MNINATHLFTLSKYIKNKYNESSAHCADDFKDVYHYQTLVLDLEITKELFEGENKIFEGWEKDMSPSNFVKFVHREKKLEIRFLTGSVYLDKHSPSFSYKIVLNMNHLAELTQNNPLKLEKIYIENY